MPIFEVKIVLDSPICVLTSTFSSGNVRFIIKTRKSCLPSSRKDTLMSFSMHAKDSAVSLRFGRFGRGLNPLPFDQVDSAEQDLRRKRVVSLQETFSLVGQFGLHRSRHSNCEPLTAEFVLEFLDLLEEEIELAGMSSDDVLVSWSPMGGKGTDKPLEFVHSNYVTRINNAAHAEIAKLPRKERKSIQNSEIDQSIFLSKFREDQIRLAHHHFFATVVNLPFPSAIANSPLFSVSKTPDFSMPEGESTYGDHWILHTWVQLENVVPLAPPSLVGAESKRYWLRCDMDKSGDAMTDSGRTVISYTVNDVFESIDNYGNQFFILFHDVYTLSDGSQWSSPWRLW